MKYNNIIFLGLCLGLTTYSALSADSVIKISGARPRLWLHSLIGFA
ncbi:fimbrial-like protein [Escherichia coli]|nr:fimbrial-like protein [Escherichia coli]